MKVPQMFCLVFLLFVSVEVLGQRQKGSRDSGNNGLGIGLHQAPENVGQTAEQSGRGRNRNDGHRRENEGGRKSGGRHSERHTEHREDRRHRNREGGRHSKHGMLHVNNRPTGLRGSPEYHSPYMDLSENIVFAF